MNNDSVVSYEENIIAQARTIIEHRWSIAEDDKFTRSAVAKDFAKLKLSHHKHEVFAVAFLNTQHNLLRYCEMFNGTIDACSVYPREVVRACIEHNAAAIILMHNHPSGSSEASSADIAITERLVKALDLIDAHVLDHIIVGKGEPSSMAETGKLPNRLR